MKLIDATPTLPEGTKIHLFESQGLGKAPYTFLGVTKMVGPIHLPDGTMVGAPGQPMGSCRSCGTGIMWAYWLKSADDKRFYVGCDCILKHGDAGLRRAVDPVKREHDREVREARYAVMTNAFADLLKTNTDFFEKQFPGPHPNAYFASKGKTRADYMRWRYEHSGSADRAKMSKGYLELAGAPVPTKQTFKKVATKGKVKREFSMETLYGFVTIIDYGDAE